MNQRFVLAAMSHETNTFSPQPTSIEMFTRGSSTGELLRGHSAIEAMGATATPFGGFYSALEQHGAEIIVPCVGGAAPSGKVTDDAFEQMAGLITDAVRDESPDAVFLELHGAMVSETYDDAEGELLTRIRALKPDIPIAVSLDFHTNMSPALGDNATVITGYCTYPHIDTFETAQRAARTLLRSLAGEIRPVLSWGVLPMMTNMLAQTPSRQPMKDIMDRAMSAEASGEVLNASVFGGFPLADIPHTGLAVVVVADGDKDAADRLREELLATAWQRRSDFVFDFEPMKKSIARAKSRGSLNSPSDGPVVIADHGDNCGAGGITDVMAVLEEVIEQGLVGVVAGPFCDPSTVQQLIDAGEGADVTVKLGGKVDMPAIALGAQPLSMSGRVVRISDGTYVATGPMQTGTTIRLGDTVLLDTGTIQVLVSSMPLEPTDLGVYTHIGIDPTTKPYLLIKSRQHFRAVYEPIASEVITVAGPGVCCEDYSQREFHNIRRPMFPMDPSADPKMISN